MYEGSFANGHDPISLASNPNIHDVASVHEERILSGRKKVSKYVIVKIDSEFLFDVYENAPDTIFLTPVTEIVIRLVKFLLDASLII